MKKRIENLQAFRGIAALGVVLYHVSASLTERHGIDSFSFLFDYGKYGVDLFFVISGFIMVIITRDTFHDRKKVAGFMYCRLSRIYPPYWFYVVLVGTVMWIRPGLFASSESSFFKSFLLLPQRQLPIVVVGWTLVYEVYFYAIFGVLLLFRRETLPKALAVWAALLLAGNYVTSGFQELIPAAVSVAIYPFSLEFIYGCLAALLLSPRAGRPPGSRRALLIVGLVTLLGQFAENATTEYWRRLLYVGIPAGVVIFFGVRLENSNKFQFGQSIRFIGDMSYSLYLSHVFTLAVYERVSALVLPSSWNTSLLTGVYVLTAVIATMVVGYASYLLVERPLIHFCRTTVPSLVRIRGG